MSRIDTASLKLNWPTAADADTSTTNSPGATTGEIRIYAHSYNVLRILSGMGGLAYSN